MKEAAWNKMIFEEFSADCFSFCVALIVGVVCDRRREGITEKKFHNVLFNKVEG